MDQRVHNERSPDSERLDSSSRPATPAFGQTRDKNSWRGHFRKRRALVPLIAVGSIILVALLVAWWLHARNYESTDDAFIDTRTVSISAQVGAAIVDVPVTDNQLVEAGAVLVRLDDRDFRAQADQATAQVDQAQANMANIDAQVAAQQARVDQANKQARSRRRRSPSRNSRRSATRRSSKKGAGTVEQAQQYFVQSSAGASQLRGGAGQCGRDRKAASASSSAARSRSGANGAGARRARAGRSQSLTHLDHRAGGRPRHAADRRQGQLRGRRPGTDDVRAARGLGHGEFQGDAAQFPCAPAIRSISTIDTYPHRTFKGHVDSIQAGSGTAFSLLPAENATGNYVKIVQRVPVKIVFDKPPDVLLGPGMSVVPTVKSAMSDQTAAAGWQSRAARPPAIAILGWSQSLCRSRHSWWCWTPQSPTCRCAISPAASPSASTRAPGWSPHI